MQSRSGTPHRRAVLGVAALVATAVVLLAAYHIDGLLRESSIAANQAFLKVAVEDRHVVIEQFLEERLNMLKVVARTPASAEGLSAGRVEPLLGELASVYADYISVSVYTRDGLLLGLAGEEDIDTAAVAGQAWFTNALALGQYISPLYLGPAQVPTLAMAVRAVTPAGDHVVRATMTLGTLNTYLSELVVGESGGTYMVDPISGSYLTHPYFGGQPLIERSPSFTWGRKHFHVDYDEHGLEEVDASRVVRADGTEVLEAHCCTRQGTWLVVVERELDEILSADRGLRRQLSAVFAVTLALLAAIVGGTYHLVRRWEHA